MIVKASENSSIAIVIVHLLIENACSISGGDADSRKKIHNFPCARENGRQKDNNRLSAFYIFPFYFIVCECGCACMLASAFVIRFNRNLRRNLLKDFPRIELLPLLYW